MTNTIKEIFVGYIICAIAGGVLEYLTPVKYRKTLRIVVVGLILAFTFSPLINYDFEFNFTGDEKSVTEDISYDALMHTANLTEKNIRSQIKEILINNGIDEYEIYITTTVDKETMTVYLDEVFIEVDKEFGYLLPEVQSQVPAEYASVLKTGVKNE